MDSIKIFETRIDNCDSFDVQTFFSKRTVTHITTLNPEILLAARKNAKLRDAINTAELNVPDGFGLHLAFWLRGKKMYSRRAGADLVHELLACASQNNFSIAFFTDEEALSSHADITESIRRKFPGLAVAFPDHPDTSQLPEGNVLIFATYGAPSQEIFLSNLKNAILAEERNDNIILIGVGGALDFFTGRVKRAPRWMRAIGLEWLYRLIQEPRYRLGRIFNAVVIFPLVLLFTQKNGKT